MPSNNPPPTLASTVLAVQLAQSSTPFVMGTLGGVTFTFTPSSDPVNLAFSSTAFGTMTSSIMPGPAALSGTMDAWASAANGATGSIISRNRQVNNTTSVTFGLNNTGYWCTWKGNLLISGNRYEITGSSSGGTASIVIKLV
jgi:hypothetical protein